ncbi:hypothetical protein BH23GEM6_BH23GEM6_28010 [soil metagenome]
MKRKIVLMMGALLFLFGVPAAPAQDRPIEEFVQRVGQLWIAGDASALVALAPSREPILLDTGNGIESVNTRHAGAALRALFGDRETIAARPVRVALAGGSPPRGFGELAWSYRTRGAPSVQTRSVYVGAVWDRGAWRITELRMMP